MVMVPKAAWLAVGGLTAAGLVSVGSAYGEPVAVPLNGQSEVNGVTVGCTGIGQSRHDPKWTSFPVRIDFAKTSGHLLADVVAAVSRADGGAMLAVSCAGPQVLLKLPAGSYSVQGSLTKSPNAKPQTATFSAPASGQRVVTLRFPDA